MLKAKIQKVIWIIIIGMVIFSMVAWTVSF